MGVQTFHALGNMLEQIVQLGIRNFQAALKTEMELAVIPVHPVIVRNIRLPELVRLRNVESPGMLYKKRLHIGNLKNSLIIACCIRIPGFCPPLFYHLVNGIHRDHLVTDLGHQSR